MSDKTDWTVDIAHNNSQGIIVFCIHCRICKQGVDICKIQVYNTGTLNRAEHIKTEYQEIFK